MFAIGLNVCLELEVDDPCLHASFPRYVTREPTALPSVLSVRGYHSLWRPVPGNFEYTGVASLRSGPKHHMSTTFPWLIRFALACFQSLLLTGSQLISLPSGTKTFHFPELVFRVELLRCRIRRSWDQRLRASSPSLSQLVTSFFTD